MAQVFSICAIRAISLKKPTNDPQQGVQRIVLKPVFGPKGLITEGQLTQNQIDARVSLVFNIGPGDPKSNKISFANSNTLELIREFATKQHKMSADDKRKLAIDIRKEWTEFCKVNGAPNKGVCKRRHQEVDLFLSDILLSQ